MKVYNQKAYKKTNNWIIRLLYIYTFTVAFCIIYIVEVAKIILFNNNVNEMLLLEAAQVVMHKNTQLGMSVV